MLEVREPFPAGNTVRRVYLHGEEIDAMAFFGVRESTDKPDGTYTVGTADAETIDLLIGLSWGEISDNVTGLSLEDDIETVEPIYTGIDLSGRVITVQIDESGVCARVSTGLNARAWSSPWSMIDFLSELDKIVSNSPLYEFDEDSVEEFGFTISQKFPTPKTECTLNGFIAGFHEQVESFFLGCMDELNATLFSDSVTLRFDFPEAVKVPCEQYLQYFVQFLKDAGVGATADLTHEAGKVLFAVTPDSKDVALDRIRQALDIYVQLPGNPSFGVTPYYNESITVQRMGITLQTFQNQLALITMENRQLQSDVRTGEQKLIQAQEIAIQALLSRQNQTDAETFVQAVKVITEKDAEKDKFKVLGGAASLKKIDGGWFEIDAPKIARDCKLPEIFEGVKRLLADSDKAEQ